MVRCFLIALVAVVVPYTGAASITGAWKVSIGTAEKMFGELPAPLDQPPGESIFFQPGDKLINLSRIVNPGLRVGAAEDPSGKRPSRAVASGWQGDWIVWNARSERVVARGSWNDIELAKLCIGGGESIPKVLRMKFELSNGEGVRTFALVSRSGEKSEGEFEGFKALMEPMIEEDGFIETRIEVSWGSGVGDSRWDVATAVTMKDGHQLRLARQGEGKDAWELKVIGVCETADGTPWKEASTLEIQGGPKPMPEQPRVGVPILAQLDARRWIGVFQMRPGELAELFPDHVKDFTTMNAPANASAWVRGPLLDIHEGFKDFGIGFGEDGSFAGLERTTDRLFVVGGESDIDLVDQVLQPMGPERAGPPVWIETNPESGAWGIACLSGGKASIKRLPEAEKDERFFEVEPTQGGDRLYFDLRYAVSIITAEDKKVGQLMSSTTLVKDRAQVVGSATGTDGKEVKVVVTAADG